MEAISTLGGNTVRGGLDGWLVRNQFVLRRLHSLSGVIPLGAFLFEHLFTNATAVYGDATRSRIFEAKVRELNELPLITLIELSLIWLPLAFHAAYGVYWAWAGRRLNIEKYPVYRNWMYLIQRISGVLVFAFLVYHVGHWRFGWFGGKVEYWQFYPQLMNTMQDPGYFWLYLFGVLLVNFHFANGLSTLAMTWGLARSRGGQRRVLPLAAVIFFGLSYLGVNTLYHFHSQGHGCRIFYRPEIDKNALQETERMRDAAWMRDFRENGFGPGRTAKN
ncbi:MAG TPA: succinate dehydrogenase [Planctomycetota bacterium]|jgi:succinate dehydrogenase / fumarate reductase cytochrome b subunit